MQPKARTLLEAHGFLDRDRMTPQHDEIQIWAYKNFYKIIKHILPSEPIDENLPIELKLEYPIVTPGVNSHVVGFVDIYCPRFGIAIEVKTRIPIIGDLLRQLQFYRKYMSGPCWIVVSMDDTFSTILKEQGIYHYKYKDPTLFF